jgi:hypothetical protein
LRIYIVLLLLSILAACNSSSSRLDFLEGTWKNEDNTQFEVWEKLSKKSYSGYAYTLEDGNKKISERLLIKINEEETILEATVPDQNKGNTITFTLNPEIDSLLSFENPTHDFPKKIQYRKINENNIEVKVIGKNNEGFSFIMTRQ